MLECCAERFRAGSGVAGTYRNTFGGAVAATVMVIAVVNVTADAVVYILLVNMTAAVVVFIFHFNVLSFLKITIILKHMERISTGLWMGQLRQNLLQQLIRDIWKLPILMW